MVALIVAGTVFAQALPMLAMKGSSDDASSLLKRAREKVLNSVRRLPKYTCLETIDRTYFVLPQKNHRSYMVTAVQPTTTGTGNRVGHLALDSKDRLRVEVAEAGGTEIHSWPGASRFDTRSFDQMISFGPITTGSFGTSLLDVFANPGAQIKFSGIRNRGEFGYSFEVPVKASHDFVKGSHGWRPTAFSGCGT